jgi:hypothetical protein
MVDRRPYELNKGSRELNGEIGRGKKKSLKEKQMVT